MRTTVKTAEITAALDILSRIIPAKPVNTVLLSTLLSLKEDGTMTLTSGDGETFICTTIPLTDHTEHGTQLLNTKVIHDILKTITDETVTLSFNEKGTCTLLWKSGKADITPSGTAGDYPQIPALKDDAVHTDIDETMLLSALSHSLYAVADDPLRPALSGVRIEMTPEGVTFVCTDSHRLSIFESPAKATQIISATLPAKPALILKSILKKDSAETIALHCDGKEFLVRTGNMTITTVALPGKFPDWKPVIPKDNTNILTVDKDYLMGAMKRATAVTSAAFKTIVLTLSENGPMTISTEDKGYMTESKETLCEGEYSGEPLSIAFKYDHIRETVSSMESERIRLLMKDSRRACLVMPGEPDPDEPFTALVMPVFAKTQK